LQASEDDDYVTGLVKYIESMKIGVDLKAILATVEERTGINVIAHLKFGKRGKAAIKYHKVGTCYNIGELNDKNEKHGRAITLWSDGSVFMN